MLRQPADGGDLVIAIVIVAFVVTAAVAGFVGLLLGRSTRRKPGQAKRLPEYSFYPFVTTPSGHVEFSADLFQKAVGHFLSESNATAAGELIVIGEQNFVRDTFSTEPLNRYQELYDTYDGDTVIDDNNAFLENYKRIVHLIGRSFPNAGIEILLHNLVNPSRSIVALESGEVTGRKLEMGTTTLVLDLKTRRQQNLDKLNYELNIGSRQFKCTTIPIFRPEYGLVGAICINVDTRFLREEVQPNPAKLEAFFENILRVEMELEENILSPDEYNAALRGKRHYMDEAIRVGGGSGGSQLAAIMFSDIVGFVGLMERSEAETLAIVAANKRLFMDQLGRFQGQLLKEMGDGLLASFSSVSNAVECAREIQRAVRAEGNYQVRIGIHLGEVRHADGDVLGEGVNLASRIQGVAEPGTIAVSQVVYDNVKNRDGIEAVDLGERRLKHVEAPVHLYSIDA
jgi:class 3 adenylate cyclase